ncbi:MAG: sensor histidine kinase [Alphaproteobacteria bacterium]|nr:sensor histidine kinase [Alphaproteobacteria bacterium]MBL7096576.1 sensor histidine kinase [Alphaproteobacteria bacterium]
MQKQTAPEHGKASARGFSRFGPRLNSLAGRLIAAAAVWTVLALLGGGFILSNAFRTSVQDDFDAELQSDMESLIAAAGHDKSGAVILEQRYLGQEFQRAYSGAYWQIVPAAGGEPIISHSLLDQTIKFTDQDAPVKGVTWGHANGPDNQHLRVLSRRIEFPVTATAKPDDSRAYVLYVAGDTRALDGRVAEFNSTIIWSFVVLGLGLIVAVFIQVRVGLQPLRKVTQSLHRIRDGSAPRLEGRFPAEIEPLAAELNSLIEHSAEVVGRARSYVSNLAHFLKTPLTVLSSEASAQPGPLADAVSKQVGIMRRQVDHYLARARAAGALDVLGNRTPVLPVLDDLARTLRRIHQDKGISIEVHCLPHLFFRGERQDLEEMSGNLIDNACKWADRSVRITTLSKGNTFQLLVEDDGPGLTEEERSLVGERGERLDESVPGTGLGLAIVRDIAKLYSGTLELGHSDLGGLRAQLTLPALASV